jgi:hypothetical protein
LPRCLCIAFSLDRDRKADQLPLAANAELATNVSGVRANGLDAELQGVCDFGVGLAPAEILQDFQLAGGQRGGRGRAAPLNQMTVDVRDVT